jgi:hypothetical protein
MALSVSVKKKSNIVPLTRGGKLCWKVENESFNTQKHGGYKLEHKYCRISCTGLKTDFFIGPGIAGFYNSKYGILNNDSPRFSPF